MNVAKAQSNCSTWLSTQRSRIYRNLKAFHVAKALGHLTTGGTESTLVQHIFGPNYIYIYISRTKIINICPHNIKNNFVSNSITAKTLSSQNDVKMLPFNPSLMPYTEGPFLFPRRRKSVLHCKRPYARHLFAVVSVGHVYYP